MDFEGQKLAEALSMAIVVVAAVLGFLYGYVRQDFAAMMWVFASGTAVAGLVGVPDWPMYNKHPVRFLPPKAKEGQRGGGSSGKGGGSGKRKKSASWSTLWGMF